MLRPYQQAAMNAGLEAIRDRRNGILVCPTGGGKAHIIAAIAGALDGRTIILQPSKEILEQNLTKLRATGESDLGIYSASLSRKDTGKTTLGTIGSVIRHKSLFAGCWAVIVDECHLVNSKGGMYEHFITSLGVPTLGLTATPYRLRHYNHHETGEHVAESRILTRTRPRIFERIAHVTQVRELLDGGWLVPCAYELDSDYQESAVPVNSTGQGYDDGALTRYNEKLHVTEKVAEAVRRTPAKHVLVFCQFRAESERVLANLKVMGIESATVDAETPKAERERIIKGFRTGGIRAVVNVGVLTVGFDFPALDCIVLARPTKSVALYYQMCGRGIRPCEGKRCVDVIDLCDNVRRFGRIETFELFDQKPGRGLWRLRSDAGPLTGVDITTKTNVESVPLPAEAEANADMELTFGKHAGTKLCDVPLGYLRWAAENFTPGKWKATFRAEVERRRSMSVAPDQCKSAALMKPQSPSQ